MFYVDTSMLVSALTNENATATCQRWLAQVAPGELAISDWVVTEFSSALALKLRTGQLNVEHRADCLAEFSRLIEESFHIIAISRQDFRSAARYTDMHETGLRAGDALHLAICANHGFKLVTIDQTLATAATKLGVPARCP